MAIHKIVALTEGVFDHRNEKRDREDADIADHSPKRVKKSIPVNTFFKSGVLERVLQYTTYQEQKEWVRVLDKKSLLKMAKWVLPEKVQKQLAARVSESEGRLDGELNRYDLALIRLLNRYYTFADEFKDEYDSDPDTDDEEAEDRADYKNSQYLLNKAPFGFGIQCRYFELPELVAELFKSFKITFEHIPDHIKTRSLSRVAVKQRPDCICDIDPRFLDAELALQTVKKQGDLISGVPEWLKTQALCEAAIEAPRGAPVLEHIPDAFKTEAICLKEVRWRASQLYNVPDHLKTGEMCDLAIANWYRWGGSVLKYIPPRLKSFDRCVAAVNADGSMCLEGVPSEFMTEAFFIALVKLNPANLGCVPSHFKTEEMCMDAIRKNPRVLEKVPDMLKTEEMCDLVLRSEIKWHEPVLNLIPKKFRTLERCVMSVSRMYSMDLDVVLRSIPEAVMGMPFFIALVKSNGHFLKSFPEHLRPRVLCLEAVKQRGDALKYVPADNRTDEIFLAAVNQDANMFDDIPERLKTKELCISVVKRRLAAILRTPQAIVEDKDYSDVVTHLLSEMVEKGQEIPIVPPAPFITEAVAIKLVTQDWHFLGYENLKSMKTEAVCSAALTQSWEALKVLPKEMKTEKMCEDALEKDLDMIRYVPKAFQTYDFFLRLVQKRGAVIAIVPDELITEELGRVALEQDASLLEFLPEDLQFVFLDEM